MDGTMLVKMLCWLSFRSYLNMSWDCCWYKKWCDKWDRET